MSPSEILAELERLANRLGVTVRFEPFDARNAGKGGFCRLHGEPLIVIAEGLPILDKIGILSEVLSTFDLEAIYLPPVLRGRVDRAPPRRAAHSPVRPPLRPPAKARQRAAR